MLDVPIYIIIQASEGSVVRRVSPVNVDPPAQVDQPDPPDHQGNEAVMARQASRARLDNRDLVVIEDLLDQRDPLDHWDHKDRLVLVDQMAHQEHQGCVAKLDQWDQQDLLASETLHCFCIVLSYNNR